MKTAYELNHVKSVSAIALLFNGKEAGKIVCNWSDNPNGAVCTATITVWAGPLADMTKATGKAGGYGYDKRSAAIADALDRAEFFTDELDDKGFGLKTTKTKDGKKAREIAQVVGGAGNERTVFEALGYQWFEVI